MVEVIDKKTGNKMMAVVICGVCYQGKSYLIYGIRRENEEVNLFVSKLFKATTGYVIDTNFSNGEKEVLDNFIKRFLNKESKEVLEKDDFIILREIDLDDNLSFDIEKCYVSTISKGLIKDILIYYDLVNESLFKQPVIEVKEDKRKFNEGFASNVVLIVFGLIILIFSVVVIYGVLFR